MEIETIISIISSVGFPIAMCVWLLVYGDKERKSHAEEVSKLAEVVQNNTVTMQRLVDKME